MDFISLICLFILQKVEWFALEDHVKMCQLKGRSEVPPQLFHLPSTTSISPFISNLIPQEECQNYIRVLAMKSPGRLLLCGTHAYKPMCREYSYKVKLSPPP